MNGSLESRPPDTQPTVEIRWPRPDLAIVLLGGEHDLASAPAVDRLVGEALLTCSHLIINLSTVQFIDSSIIHLLVRARKDADDRGSHFNLVLGEAQAIERTLEICGVLASLNRVPDIETALKSVPSPDAPAAHPRPGIGQLAAAG